ncbi:MAG: hypothetical protein AAFX05_14520, partial [Planctomycetota bacterium]
MDWSLKSGRWTAAQKESRAEIGAGTEVGAVVLERRLGRHALADRWLARHACGAPALAYQVDRRAGVQTSRAFVLAVSTLLSLEDAHITHPESVEAEAVGGRWLITGYPGVFHGLMTLSNVLRERPAGVLRPTEVIWLARHLLSASAYAHPRGVSHGRVDLAEVIIDRDGRAAVELYGLARRLHDTPIADSSVAREEIESIADVVVRAAIGRWPDGRQLTRSEMSAMPKSIVTWIDAVRSGACFDAKASLACID